MKIQNTSRPSGDTGTKLRTERKKTGYTAFQVRIMRRFCISAIISTVIVVGLYLFLWKHRMGDWIISLMELWMDMDHEEAFLLYNNYFRGYREIFFAVAIILVFLLLLWYLFRWMARYFREINSGIDSLLSDHAERIQLSPEMEPIENKLNSVQNILTQRAHAARTAEQR